MLNFTIKSVITARSLTFRPLTQKYLNKMATVVLLIVLTFVCKIFFFIQVTLLNQPDKCIYSMVSLFGCTKFYSKLARVF